MSELSSQNIAAPRSSDLRSRRILQLLVILALIVPRWLAYRSAGGLWRDEAHSVDMAIWPSGELWFVLANDSFPMLWAVLLRTWVAIFGSTDPAVRLFGFLIGSAIIPTMWWVTRQFGVAFPWSLMVLLGLDPNLIVFGGEVRGYGLGLITFLILIGTSWNTLKRPDAWHWVGLLMMALLAVQSSFTNCFLLLATFVSCGIVATRRGRFRVCLGFMLVGIVSAVSMIPYALYVYPHASKGIGELMGVVSWQRPVQVFLNTYLSRGLGELILWPTIGLLAVLGTFARLKLPRGEPLMPSVEEEDLSWFLPVFVVIGSLAFWFYIFWLGVLTHEWYYLPFLTLLAVATELGFELWLRQHQGSRFSMIVVLLFFCAFIVWEDVQKVCVRLTTIDQTADILNREVHEGDLILVVPWYFGVTFNRYYHGPAEWMNLPDVDRNRRHNGSEELREHRLPLSSPQAITKELQKIEDVLRSGGRVWCIGLRDGLPPKGFVPEVLSGAPHPTHGWKATPYTNSWVQLAIARMYAAGATPKKCIAHWEEYASRLESPTLYVFDPPLSSKNRFDSKSE